MLSNPPGATVELGGTPRGQTPLTMALEEGRYDVALVLPQHRRDTREVQVTGEQATRLRVDLVSTVGKLEVLTNPPGATVEIGDTPRGQTPGILTLEEGTYEVAVVLPHYRREARQVAIVGAQTSRLDLKLTSTQGTLEVASAPAGATVEIGGTPRGQTPLTLTLVQDAYDIELRLPKHRKETRRVQIIGEQTTHLQLDLIEELFKAGEIQRRGKDNAEMVYIPAALFAMGDTHGDGHPDELPSHIVTVETFWLDRTEVTNAQFARFVTAGNTAQGYWDMYARGKDQHPVVNVTWHDAVAYCRWAGKRLPTEAEWEYAARGSDGRKYPWGNTWEDSRARFYGNRGSETTAPVGSYPTGASPFGVMDLAGNVWEWVSSQYEPYPYVATDGRENLSAPGRRVFRGGSWSSVPRTQPATYRGSFHSGYASDGLGFRCAQNP